MNDKDSEESSSDSDEDERDDGPSTSREKRGAQWCDVQAAPKRNSSPTVSWPPDPSAVGSNSWRNNLRHVKPGNNYSMFGTKMQLFCKTSYNLAVYPDGAVRGTMDDKDLHTHLEVTSAGYVGHVRIRGCLANLFVAMDRKGRLYGEPDVTEEGTVFIEAFQGSYNTYLSRKYAHLGWYLGIKKSGKFKRGPKTSYRQKAVMFLPRRSKFQ